MSEVWTELLDELDELHEQILDLSELTAEQAAAVEQGDMEAVAEIERIKERVLPGLHRANTLLRAILRDRPTFEELEDLGVVEVLVALQGLSGEAQTLEQTVAASYHVKQFKIRNFLKALRKASLQMTRYTQSGAVVTVDTSRPDEHNDI
ncbi:hypothetical protein ACFSM5_07400 [Lacibacterium aquatile]|uniref:Flagellar protein FlgN n=1 Tax=Lacibacterium aquatile TaxID=1168082 RepID=A0ABW5DS53_9PROT